jgi:hypothetical protein
MLQVTGSYSVAVNNGYGLIFQVAVGEEADDFYSFRVSGDGFYTVEKAVAGELTPLIDWTESSQINLEEGAENVLTVVGEGDSYAVYINGQQVDSFTDGTLSGGTFGLMVDNYDTEAPAAFTFDDLILGTAAQ